MNLKEWLADDNRDYDVGLVLFRKYSKNRILFQRLSRKPFPEKLFYELKKVQGRFELIEMKNGTVIQSEKKDKGKIRGLTPQPKCMIPHIEGTSRAINGDPNRLIIVRGNRQVDLNKLPEELQKLWHQNTESYKLARNLHEKLKLMKDSSPEERKPLVVDLDKYNLQIRQNWAKIDEWKPGQMKDNTEDGDEPGFKDPERIQANRTYLSKNKARLDELEGEEKQQLVEAIQERVDELVKAGKAPGGKQVFFLKKHGIKV